MPMRSGGAYAVLLLILTAWPGETASRIDRIAAARQAYNSGNYDAAVEAATAAATEPKTSAEARLLLGRALVERFRRTAQPEDLAAARTALLDAGNASLPGTLHVEWLIGSAETLFFEERYGAAATLLEGVLEDPRADLVVPGGRERLIDWWASALDRAVQERDPRARGDEYAAFARRLARELERDPSLGSAAYWQVVAMRGQGDLDSAWDAAQAAWVRAPLAHDRGAALRADLDRIVLQALIPERARRAGRDPDKHAGELREEWEGFKKRWSIGNR